MGEAWDAAKAHHKAVLFTQLFQRPSFPQVVPNQFLLVLGRHKPLQQLQEVKTQRLQVITAKGESKQKGRYSFVNSQAIFLTAHPDMTKNVYETLNIKSLGKKNKERREEIRKSRRDITKKNVWKASSSLHFLYLSMYLMYLVYTRYNSTHISSASTTTLMIMQIKLLLGIGVEIAGIL